MFKKCLVLLVFLSLLGCQEKIDMTVYDEPIKVDEKSVAYNCRVMGIIGDISECKETQKEYGYKCNKLIDDLLNNGYKDEARKLYSLYNYSEGYHYNTEKLYHDFTYYTCIDCLEKAKKK